MRRELVLSISAVVLTWSATAMAAPPQLKGQYAYSGTVDCLFSNTPFNLNLTPTGPVESTTSSVVGIETFNGDGTGKMTARNVAFNPPPPATGLPQISANSSDATANITYSFDNDGGLTTDIVPGTFLATFLTGPGAGSTFTVDKLNHYGMVSTNGQMITLASAEPVMETQTITPVGGPQIIRYRVCHRSQVLIWIGK